MALTKSPLPTGKIVSGLGRALREFPDLPFLEIIIAPYRFFYRIKGRIIWFVAVWHGAQLPEEPHEAESA